MEKLFSPEGAQSNETLPALKPPAKPVSKPKRAAAKTGGKPRKSKSPKRSVRKATPKRKPAKKRAKPSKRAATSVKAKKTGRPLTFIEQTVVRLPKGWLLALNAKCKAKDVGQGEFLRDLIGRAIGKKVLD